MTGANKTLPDKGFELTWCEYQNLLLSESVQQAYHHWTAEQVLAAMTLGAVRVNGDVQYQDIQLQPADHVSLFLPEHQEDPVDTGWKLLWKTNELMAVHKPAGLPVSRTTRNLFDTLISMVRRATEYKDAHLLHRLDAETSGVILLANHEHADKRWKKKLDRLLQKKIYHALVWGNPGWDTTECECYLAEKADSPIRTQMHVTGEHDDNAIKAPKLARTGFRVLKRFNGYALVECELFSGRKHQIRAQLAHLGHAIIGDKIYSHDGRFYLKRLQQDLAASDIAALGATHHLLHAWRVEVDCGYEQTVITDDDYPAEFQRYLHQP
ncbi:RluA family pseudouridine synthase [Thalassolituus sp. LLYu03]|uniref:RluA family pseudouridine synthase n=1 Tax=Thalassolituus sp. LLYu03 TaxID=3421656 RepID=UPI003D26E370